MTPDLPPGSRLLDIFLFSVSSGFLHHPAGAKAPLDTIKNCAGEASRNGEKVAQSVPVIHTCAPSLRPTEQRRGDPHPDAPLFHPAISKGTLRPTAFLPASPARAQAPRAAPSVRRSSTFWRACSLVHAMTSRSLRCGPVSVRARGPVAARGSSRAAFHRRLAICPLRCGRDLQFRDDRLSESSRPGKDRIRRDRLASIRFLQPRLCDGARPGGSGIATPASAICTSMPIKKLWRAEGFERFVPLAHSAVIDSRSRPA